MLEAPAARPLPLMALTDFSLLFQTRANRSPPTPVELGSTTFSVAAAVMAASVALPPSMSTCNPAMAASGWLVATIPLVARTVLRRESKYIREAFNKLRMNGLRSLGCNARQPRDCSTGRVLLPSRK